MSILRCPRNHPFTITDNRAVNHGGLSANGLACLTYILSKPDNWTVIPSDIQARFGWGRDRCYETLRELVAKGWAERSPKRSGYRGRLSGYTFTVFDQPISPVTDSPGPGKAAPFNKTIEDR